MIRLNNVFGNKRYRLLWLIVCSFFVICLTNFQITQDFCFLNEFIDENEQFIDDNLSHFDDDLNNKLSSSDISLEKIKGEISILLILTQFSDDLWSNDKDSMEEKYFGSVDSLSHYFNESSYGNVKISGTATQWISLPETRSYYGNDSDTGIDDYYSNPEQICTDSFIAADTFVDFSQYDEFIVVHSGYNQKITGDLNDTYSSAFLESDGFSWSYDGSSINRVCILSEFDPLGIICSEFLNLLGLPNLNSSSDSEEHYIDNWGLMANGSINNNYNDPIGLCGFSKLKLGLIDDDNLKVIQDDTICTLELDDLTQNNEGYSLIKLPLNDETNYYLIEARFQNSYDQDVPDEGVLISKINENKLVGQGIVEIIDAFPETATLDDAVYDVSSSTENAMYCDDIYGITIIIMEKSEFSFKVYINRDSLFSYSDQILSANSEDTYVISGLEMHQEIVWDWKRISGGNYEIDFWIEHFGGSDFEIIENVEFDVGVFKVPVSGNYIIHLRNENEFYDSNYRINYTVHSAPSLEYLSIDYDPDTIYLNGNINISLTIRNNGTSTAKNLQFEITLPESHINLQMGDVYLKNTSELGYLEEFHVNWNLTAVGWGTGNMVEIKINCSSNEWENFTSFSIDQDLIDPTFELNQYSNGFLNNQSDINLNWSASDAESGLKEFRIYQNDSLITTIDGTQLEYDITDLDDGIWNFTIECYDNVDHCIKDSTIVQIDRTIPSISQFIASSSFVSPYHDISFNVTTEDFETDIDYIQIYGRNSTESWILLNEFHQYDGNFNFTLTLGNLSRNEFQFMMYVVDIAGNLNISSILTLNVDSENPIIEDLNIFSDAMEDDYTSGNILLKITAEDFESEIEQVIVEFSCNGETYQGTAKFTQYYYQYLFDSSSISGIQQAEIKITVIDSASNEENIYRYITIDNSGEHPVEFMKYVPYLVGTLILLVGLIGTFLIIRSRRNPYQMIARLDAKKEKFLQKQYLIDGNSGIGRDPSEIIENPDKKNEHSVESISEVQNNHKNDYRVPEGFSYLESEEIVFDIPEIEEKIERLSRYDKEKLKQFFGNIEKMKFKEDGFNE